jgi:hypothetical protein
MNYVPRSFAVFSRHALFVHVHFGVTEIQDFVVM